MSPPTYTVTLEGEPLDVLLEIQEVLETQDVTMTVGDINRFIICRLGQVWLNALIERVQPVPAGGE